MKKKLNRDEVRISLKDFKENVLNKNGNQRPRKNIRMSLDVDPSNKNMSSKEYREAVSSSEKKSKYNAQKTYVDGIMFDSRWEAKRYSILKIQEKAGEIKDLKLQVSFPIVINDIKVTTYISDFTYFDMAKGEVIVEDSKGFLTPEYKLKRSLMKAVLGIEIFETRSAANTKSYRRK